MAQYAPISVSVGEEDHSRRAVPRVIAGVGGVLLVTLAIVALVNVGHESSSGTPSTSAAATDMSAAPSDFCLGRPDPTSGVVPEDIISDLDTKWKLQLPCQDDTCSEDYSMVLNACPSGQDGPDCVTPSIASISASSLATYELIPRAYTVGDTPYCTGGFYASTDADGTPMVVLNNPVSGVTTSGSENPRMELREMTNGGTTNAAFPLTDSKQTEPTVLHTTHRIVHLPPVQQSLCFAQLFIGEGANSGPFVEFITKVCTYSWQKYPDGTRCPAGTLAVMVWKDGQAGGKSANPDYDGIPGGMVLAPFTLGTKFTATISLPGDGNIDFTYQPEGGDAVNWTGDCTDGSGCTAATDTGSLVYFKTGSYVQQAPDEPTDSYALSYVYSADVADYSQQ